MKKLIGRHFLCDADLSAEEMLQIFKTADLLKTQARARRFEPLLAGRNLAMIFEQTSTRTRVSFEVGMRQLGGQALFLSANDLKLARGEPLRDTARVLSSYCDAIMARIFSQENLEEIARYSAVPVINGMTNHYHPCQALTDLFTLYEVRGTLKGLKLAFLGDGNNVCQSLLLTCARLGVHVHSAHPEGFFPADAVVARAREIASQQGSRVEVGSDPWAAVRDADAVYTDVWHSPGQPGTLEERIERFRPFQVNDQILSVARPECIVLHCLPARRGEELTDEVMEGPRSRIFQQAENRLHVQKALLAHLVP
ncbi:MAG TPA: ornithine carbamoyltransferase [Candidatus Nitrosotenuis sp.]|nr:ornithine carbamoyltransferase [Candidatus Nitrosotenuis sp.]